MASVRLSNDLRGTILRNAIQAFDVSTPQPQYKTADVDFIIDLLVNSKTQETLARIAADFAQIPHYKPEWGYNQSHKPSFGFTAPYGTKITGINIVFDPENSSSNGRSHIEFNRPVELYAAERTPEVPIVTIEDPAARQKVRDIVFKHKERTKEYKDKRLDYSATIERLLYTCSTLKQFLDAWPAGESFVPQGKMNELHTKVTRIQKARQIKEDINFDDTAVNQVVLTSKLMGN